MQRALCAIVVGLLGVVTAPAGEAFARRDVGAQQLSASIVTALDRYETGDFATVRALAASTPDVTAFVRVFAETAPGWIGANGPTVADARRFRAAAAALEIAWAVQEALSDFDEYRRRWPPLRTLIEWACGLVRVSAVPTPTEELWFLASVELIHGVPDLIFLNGPPRDALPHRIEELDRLYGRHLNHLGHAEARFPANATFRLVRRERWNGGSGNGPSMQHARRWVSSGRSVTPAEFAALQAEALGIRNRWALDDRMRQPTDMTVLNLVRLLTDLAEIRAAVEPLLAMPEARANAHFDLALIALCFADSKGALQHLAEIDRATGDTDLRYLGRFLQARVHAHAGRREAAEQAYRDALAIRPLTRSATAALGEILFTSGRRQEAATLAEEFLASPRELPSLLLRRDPWDQFTRTGPHVNGSVLLRLRKAIAQ